MELRMLEVSPAKISVCMPRDKLPPCKYILYMRITSVMECKLLLNSQCCIFMYIWIENIVMSANSCEFADIHEIKLKINFVHCHMGKSKKL